MAEQLLSSRNSIKGSIMRIHEFVLGSNAQTDTASIEIRNKTLDDLFSKYDNVQMRLETLGDADTDYAGDRIRVEDLYYETKTQISNLLQATLRHQTDVQISNVNESYINQSKQIKLPRISLPLFKGDYTEWYKFRDIFCSLVHENRELAEIQKFQYLKSTLQGEPSNLISSIHLSEENYRRAWDILLKRYDKRLVIVNNHVKALLELPSVQRSSVTGLRNFLGLINQHYNALKGLDLPVESWDILLIYILSKKLDYETVKAWELQRSQTELPTFTEFLEFLDRRSVAFESLNNTKVTSHVHTVINGDITRVDTCTYCSGTHRLVKCYQFLKESPDRRREFVTRTRLCYNCLSNMHRVTECRVKVNCQKCHRRHHVLLHSEMPLQGTSLHKNQSVSNNEAGFSRGNLNLPIGNESQSEEPSVLLAYQKRQVLLTTAEVNIKDRDGNWHTRRALLDSGSQFNFITVNLAEQLGLTVNQNFDISVQGIGGHKGSVEGSVTVLIKSKFCKYRRNLNCSVIKLITSSLPQQFIDTTDWKIPNDANLADPQFNIPHEVDILIGAEMFYEILNEGRTYLGPGKPVLQNSVLGWLVAGSVMGKQRGYTSWNTNLAVGDDGLSEIMTRFWLLEEFKNKDIWSKDDQVCENNFIKTTTRDQEGRYEVQLPVIKENLNKLGESFSYAYKCFLTLEKRLAKNTKLFMEYSKFIREYVSLGHAVVLCNADDIEDAADDYVYYMPHHAVVKESSSTTKLRVVFNASAPTTTGVTLNDCLMVGPTVQPELWDILINFRTYRYAFSADLQKMYRQIKVNSSQQNLQRILWRESPNEPVKCLKLLTVTYGTAPASYLATRTLLQLSRDEGYNFSRASKAIRDEFYVDDVLTGSDNLQDAILLRDELTYLLNKGGFTLHKWSSNDLRLLNGLDESFLEKRHVSLGDDDSFVKTLGLVWNPGTDMFKISVPGDISSSKNSKRVVLRGIARIFDPLGLVGPVAAAAKMLMQDIWRKGLNWDDPLPQDILGKSGIRALGEINVPRLMFLHDSVDIQLHGFGDASMKGYGACIYLRTGDPLGQVKTTLVCSKSRVAFIKTVSLPRLELCAAVLVSKLVHKVFGVLTGKIGKVYLWTDSMIVLGWLNGDPSRWNVFVANRVVEIQKLTSDYQWNHIASEHNPSDLLSRGVDPSKLKGLKQWWSGPDWLSLDKRMWEFSENSNGFIELPDARKVGVSGLTVAYNMYFVEVVFKRFSSFSRLVRTFAYVLKFIKLLKKQNLLERGILTVDDLHCSKIAIIKCIQNFSFGIELRHLHDPVKVSKVNILKSLNPFLDEHGLLRVGGRLSHSSVCYSQRHPIILPSKNHVTRLILQYEHIRLMHAGVQQVLYSIRLKYWPINARTEIKTIIHNCVTCFKHRASGSIQLMADLPAIRVTPARAFLNVGVDYAGPFPVLQSRLRKASVGKGYICIFVCLVTRAIHIEFVVELSTRAFLNALDRFIGRRGLCKTIYSDRGTNFQGAKNELSHIYKLFHNSDSYSQIVDASGKVGIKWDFIPPGSPHWGGIWEAGVKSVKHHIKRISNDLNFTYEEWHTLLVKIEAIVNSRPLCAISDDPNDLNVLTPAHFLIGDALTTLPEIDVCDVTSNRLKLWQQVNKMQQTFWKRWNVEYLATLQQRYKWNAVQPNVKVGDMVLLKEDTVLPLTWTLARVLETFPGKDGLVRAVSVRTKNRVFTRPITKVAVLPLQT